MAGNPENPLLKKLRIQPGQHIAILNAPEDYRASLGELPEGVTVSEHADGRFDLVHLFQRGVGAPGADGHECRQAGWPAVDVVPQDQFRR